MFYSINVIVVACLRFIRYYNYVPLLFNMFESRSLNYEKKMVCIAFCLSYLLVYNSISSKQHAFKKKFACAWTSGDIIKSIYKDKQPVRIR